MYNTRWSSLIELLNKSQAVTTGVFPCLVTPAMLDCSLSCFKIGIHTFPLFQARQFLLKNNNLRSLSDFRPVKFVRNKSKQYLNLRPRRQYLGGALLDHRGRLCPQFPTPRCIGIARKCLCQYVRIRKHNQQ